MRSFVFILTLLSTQMLCAITPCPPTRRHVAANGVYFELGGGSIYSSMGYAGTLNLKWHNYIAVKAGYVYAPLFVDPERARGLTTAVEFHAELKNNSPFHLTLGLALTCLYDADDLEGQNVMSVNKEDYLAPMIGMEMLLWNRFSTELKFQPNGFFSSGEWSGFRPYAGLQLKILFGRTAISEPVYYYR